MLIASNISQVCTNIYYAEEFSHSDIQKSEKLASASRSIIAKKLASKNGN